jgi:acyltransferase
MKKVIIFGIGENAQLLKYYLENDENYRDDYRVIAFTLDKDYIKEKNFMGVSLIPFEEIEKYYTPKDFYCFIAVGYKNMNELRERKLFQIKEKGFKTMNYISSKACIYNDLVIGENNFIMDNQVIQPFVKIGNNNVFYGGGVISHHSIIGNNCFFGAGVVIAGGTTIKDNCFIGVNSIVSGKVTIEYKTFISAGGRMSKNTKQNGVYISDVSKRYKINSVEIL